MNRTDYLRLMATYNESMNAKLYMAAMTLPDQDLAADKNAFFGSVLGTLNHLMIADTIWLKRFAAHPANYRALGPINVLPYPTDLREWLHADIRGLWTQRQWMDRVIVTWAESVAENDLDHVLHYARNTDQKIAKNFFGLVMHFFNHQTHHRGQATTLLTQSGVDIGVTDLLALIPDQAAAQPARP
jgi:uncharacterized damage-inducible protein DinB